MYRNSEMYWLNFPLLDYNQRTNHMNNQMFQRQHRNWMRTRYGSTFRYNQRYSQPFVLMSYNILAQVLLEKHPHLYRNNEPQHLEWNYRLECLKNEILAIRPAILCLQEVQNSHLDEIEMALQPMQYTKPLYKQRTRNGYIDGCAIFYDSQQFQLIDHHYVEFYQPGVKVNVKY